MGSSYSVRPTQIEISKESISEKESYLRYKTIFDGGWCEIVLTIDSGFVVPRDVDYIFINMSPQSFDITTCQDGSRIIRYKMK
jgi:hypothetical protein